MTDHLPDGFVAHDLDEQSRLLVGRLPDHLVPDDAGFEAVWALHPEGYNVIHLVGRKVPIPRYQQSYERAYRFSGLVHRPLPAPPAFRGLLDWAKESIDGRLNGLLVNWYDGQLGHYIGAHRDSTAGLVGGAPIVTVSLGEERAFRMRPWKGKGFRDFPADHGSVIVIPFDTNTRWTHEVPKSAARVGRRVSVTIRAFAEE